MVVFFGISLVALVWFQLVKYKYYLNMAINRTMAQDVIIAPRGEIYDRYGRPIVTNESGFSLIFQYSDAKKTGINKLILNSAQVLLSNGDTYVDEFPISFDKEPVFVGEDFSAVLEEFNLPKTTTAKDLLNAAIKKYDIDEKLTVGQKRIVAGVRYEMTKQGFSKLASYTFSTSISTDSMMIFKEQSDKFLGAVVNSIPERRYASPKIASHILGSVGVISEKEYEEKRDKGYKKTDLIGKEGLEKYLETYLKGVDGVSSTYTDSKTGEISTIKTEPEAGSYAALTIDLELQKTLEKSLANTILEIQKYGDSRGANSGSAVVLDVNTGEVLAMASYPTYDLKNFRKDYAQIIQDKSKPLFNRAISGAYAPGSTFKILTAIAGLEEGVITPQEKIVDRGVYEYEGFTDKNYKPACWFWNTKHMTHGAVNVADALKVSCNYYFFDVGRRLGISKLNEYSKKFGLGQKTGIEIAGNNEVVGVLAGREERQKRGQAWYNGDLLQAAIGQSDNQFTPLQLADFVAAVANGGTLYQPHLVKSIKKTNNEEIFTATSVKLNQIKISKTTLDYVKKGLRDVTETGTASGAFRNYPIPIAGKTGSAQVGKNKTNGIFVAFAPAEKPEIAISIVVENAAHGSYTAYIAKALFDKYFNQAKVVDKYNIKNTLIP